MCLPCACKSVLLSESQVSPTLKDVFFSCIWRGKYYRNCQGIFSKVLTKEGVCYNFNSMAANEMFKYDSIQRDYSYMDSSVESRNWSAEIYYFNADSNAYPWRGMANEAHPGLQITLKSSANELDTLCDGMNKGYKIYLQHPADFPQASLSYYAASLHKVTSLALKFNMITTSTSLESYSPNVRKCYFPGDHPLQYFQIYTQNNCQLECQSNFAFKKCGCVRFYMPHNDSESICTPKMNYCVKKALDELAELQLTAELNFEIPTCGCFPACTSIDYDAEMTNTDYDLQTVAKIYDDFLQRTENRKIKRLPETEEYSKIDLYFKGPRFVAMRRSELYSSTELLANCGGLLGLFLGFSFLSLIEIAYFATIRLCCRLKRDLKTENQNADKRSD